MQQFENSTLPTSFMLPFKASLHGITRIDAYAPIYTLTGLWHIK